MFQMMFRYMLCILVYCIFMSVQLPLSLPHWFYAVQVRVLSPVAGLWRSILAKSSLPSGSRLVFLFVAAAMCMIWHMYTYASVNVIQHLYEIYIILHVHMHLADTCAYWYDI